MLKPWQTLQKFVEISSPWMTLIGEKLRDDRGRVLDYWRLEKDDSVIIITIHNNQLLFPHPMYRPGVSKLTLDFPGGRVASSLTPRQAAMVILQKELGITESDLDYLTPLNDPGWEINSSFSNQKLYGFVARVSAHVSVHHKFIGITYALNPEEINDLLTELTCLQCRALFLEWLRKNVS
jgi:hypothetical protein